ncbi:MAG TPA: response regulator transcription factor [Dehalococcoidia bacterium]|nr:response regulator transcription factor [Dehalococcoidia bacterium]
MPSRKVSVLVVDDDVHILRMMQHVLELEGYRVVTASNGESALDVFAEESPDLVLLDIKMPGMDGYTACQRIREFSQVPIIMVTAKGDEVEKVQGLDAGADDYVTKPFSTKELAARVRAVLRRTVLWDESPEPAFHSHDLIIDFAHRSVMLDSQKVNLTATEYRLLSYMARNSDRVVIPDQILEKVWGEEYLGETHLLQVNIARLRRKLSDDAKNPRYILTRPGIGYTMVKQA